MVGSVNIVRGSADDLMVAARRYVGRELLLGVMTKDKGDRVLCKGLSEL